MGAPLSEAAILQIIRDAGWIVDRIMIGPHLRLIARRGSQAQTVQGRDPARTARALAEACGVQLVG